MTTEVEPTPRLLRRLNLNLLYSLDAILRFRTLTEAGHEVSLSQPAMSLALRQLRKHFRDDLVIYAGGNRVLTARARALQPRIRRLLSEMHHTLMLDPEFDPASATQTIRIAAPESIEVMFVGRVVPRLVALAPNMRFELMPCGHANAGAMFDAGADVAILSGTVADDRFDARPLLEDQLSCVVREGHPTIGTTIDLEQFLSARHAAVSKQGESLANLGGEAQAIMARRSIAVTTSYYSALPNIILRSDLIGTASSWHLQFYASVLPLRVLPLPFRSTVAPIMAQWQRHRAGEPLIDWLLDNLAASV